MKIQFQYISPKFVVSFSVLLSLVLLSACAVSFPRMEHPTKGDPEWHHDLDNCQRRADEEHARDHDAFVRDCLHQGGWR